jgi:peroxiredoxin
MELEALQEAVPEFEAAGATLVAVSPMVERFVRQIVRKHSLTFPVLMDRGNTLADRYGLVYTLPDYLKELYLRFGNDLPKFNGDDSWTLPMPGRFVIDREGIIRSAEVSPDYTARSEPAKAVMAIKTIAPG